MTTALDTDANSNSSPPDPGPVLAVAPTLTPPLPDIAQPEPDLPAAATLEMAAQDVRRVLEVQREQNQILTTKLNILFVANGALLTTLSISHLAAVASPFSVIEVLGFLINFTLLVQAFLPRQMAITPNLEDRKVLERYLGLSAVDYQLKMLVNLAETYHANKQRLDDISGTLRFSAYATWVVAVTILLHMVTVYFFIQLT